MSTDFNKVKSGVIFTKAAQKQDLQSGDTIPEALGKLAKYMDVTDDALSNIQPILTFDSEPEYESLNPVTSGGLYDYIELQSPTYINTFSTESDLYSYSGNLTNNDYAFVGTGSGATYYMNVYQYKSEFIRDTIEDIKTTPSGSNILKTLNEPALPTGNIQYKLDCYVTAVNNQSYGTSPVITVIFSDNTTSQITVPNANKTHIVKTYSKTIKAIQFMNSGQASNGYTDFEDIQILTTAGWNKLSYRLYNPTWDANQLSAINSGITSTKVTNYDNHIANKSNPHEVTKSQIGLGNVGNFKAVSTETSQGLTSTEQSNARTNINAQESLSFNGTYNASTNKVATESTVTDAINALDVSSQGGAGKYISEISETNGKLSATPTTMDTSLSNSSKDNNCPTSKTVYDDQQRQDAALAEVENKGAKNLFDIQHPSTVRSTSYNATADGGVELTCSNAAWTQYIITDIPVESGREYAFTLYVDEISGTNTFRVYIRDNDSTGNVLFDSNNVSTVKTINATITSDSGKIWVGIYINNSATAKTASAKIRAMLCTKAEWDISHTYVPYGKTNAELTAENTSQQTEINYAINTGVKNLFDVRKATFGDTSKISISVDDTVTSTVTSDGRLWDWANREFEFTLPAGTYIFKYSVVSGTVSSALRFRLLTQTENPFAVLTNTKNSVTFTLASDTTLGFMGKPYALSFKLQIQNAVITDQTYEPYALPNPTLTPAAIKAVDDGAKNLLHFDRLGYSTVQGMSMVHRGVTFTLTDDTVVCSGTNDNTDNSHCRLYIGSNRVYVTDLCDGNHILSGAPSGGGVGKWSMSAYYGVSGVTTYNKSDYGEGVLLTEPSESGYNILIDISISKGQNASGLIFKPMICTAADWAVSQKFVPYAPTNRELYETKATVDDIFGVKASLTAGTDLNDITTPGKYACGGATAAAQLLHCPTTANGFIMLVDYVASELRIIQRIYSYNTTSGAFEVFYRSYISTGWTDWQRGLTDATLDEIPTTNSINAVMSGGVQAPLEEVIDNGAKNLLNNSEAVSQTVGGVTFTLNADGSITANGTKNNNDWFIFSTGNSLKAGTYVLYDGLPVATQNCQLFISTTNSFTSAIMTTGANSRPVTQTLTQNYTGLYYAIRIASGTVVNNLTFYPMLCTKAQWDVSQQYVPYALPNSTLTAAEIELVDNGAKNILDYTFSINGDTSARTSNGVTFTINADRSISTSGTASANITAAWIQMNYVVPSDPVILSGCPAGGAYNKYKIDILDGNQTGSIVASDYGNGVVIKSSMFTNGIGLIRIRIEKGQNVDGLVFKPMICTKAAWEISQKFVPYAPTNRELYETKADLLSDIDSSTTITAYVDSLAKGHYTSFIANTNRPSDAPVADNAFIEIYIYSANTALIRAFPTGSVYGNQFFQKSKVSGVWRNWIKFEGTEVT